MERRNAEGYHDPTAYMALRNEPRTPARVYIVSPYHGDTTKNAAAANRYCRFAMNGGSFPIAPHAWFHGYLDDDVPEERELGMKFGQHQMNSCGQVWVFGSVISSGMQSEISSALLLGKKVRYFTNDCQELRK